MTRARQTGAFLVAAIVILTVMALMTVTLGYLSSANTGSGIVQSIADKAFYVAFSGLERATAASADPAIGNRSNCAAQTAFSNVAVGSGVFTLSSATVAYNGGTVSAPAPTTLSAAISAGTNVIPVTSVTGYASTGGRIMIDREFIDYAATSGSVSLCGTPPCLLASRRGADNTVAAAHAIATRVGAYQCEVQVAGGVPDLSGGPTSARRTLGQATQLGEVWAAGAQAVAGTMLMNRFQETAWSDLNTGLAVTHLTSGVNSISMLSYADGFAVGTPSSVGVAAQQPLVLRWSGSAWSAVNTGLNQNRVLTSISCISANDCWAVGEPGAGATAQPWIIRWNGVWTNDAKGALAAANTTLNAISCTTANECWAVGNAFAGAEYFIQLTGGVWARPPASAAIANVDFLGVHCRDTSNCWATGAGSNIVYWNGSVWVTEAIGGAAFTATLNSVWCTSNSDCWAVGDTPTAGAAGEVILRRQAGAAPNWTRVAPTAAIPDVNLAKVACAGTNDCWAVGTASAGELILRWDGSSWARMGPSGTVTDRNLNALAVIGPSSRPYAARQELFP